jgi:type I restriction enzyme S subunit
VPHKKDFHCYPSRKKTTAMLEKQLVLQLRFPEFNGEWEKHEFKDIAKRSKKSYNPNRDNENFPCVELESLTQETGQLIQTFDSISLKSNKTRFSKNEVLFGKLRPYLRKYLLTTFEGVCTSEIWVFQGKLIINSYLYYLIQTEKFNYEANVSSGSKMPRTDWDYLSGIKFLIPTFSEEQQKIASFLTEIDTKLSQLTKKKALLENYKKGVMQQIFSQELRFKDDDGNDYGDWEEKKLGEVATKKSSNIAANTIQENNGDYKIYGASGFLKNIDFYRESETYISIVKDGAGVGRTLLCEAFSSVLGTLDTIKPKKEIHIYFIYCLLNNMCFLKYVTGSTIPHIYFKDYSKEKIKVPSLEEQTKIADFLSNLDTKIEVLSTSIENTQTFKKGLLQQLFV